MHFNISYIIATRNRFDLLKITLEKLIGELLPEEEIVVVDGNSSDGAKEYLQELFDSNKIQQFVSEPDHNQAHGWNKALLMANGTIIKKIIDDDVHDYKSIRKCANYMLQNPQIDICISNCLTTDLASSQHIDLASRLFYYEKWKAGKTACFTFSDVYMLIRKSSLSYFGLFDTQFAMIDWEYSLRCSYLKAGIAYYTGCNSLAVSTPGNVTSTTFAERLAREGKIGELKYGYKGDRSDISLYSELKIFIGKTINYKSGDNLSSLETPTLQAEKDLAAIYKGLYQHLEEYNKAGDFSFIS